MLSSLGVDGEPDALGLGPTGRTVVLLVDGMGEQLLRAHADVAPFLTSLQGRVLTAGFPATTVTSLTSLGTGLPPGEHGLTGYSSYVEELGEPINWLAWSPVGRGQDLRSQLVPEAVQARPTALERAAAGGVTVTVAAPAQFEGTGLTRAVLRGGRFAGTVTPGDAIAETVAGAGRAPRTLVYCYVADLDTVGHVRGPGSEAWRVQLRLIDVFAEQLAARLPPDARLLVTADHGMVEVADAHKVDFDDSLLLQDGVRALAGEPRARHVHTRPGARDDVLAAWRHQLGERMWVGTRQDAVAAGLFGSTVTGSAAGRIGDVLAIAHAEVAVVRRRTEQRFSALPGQHGALTDDELLVPLLST